VLLTERAICVVSLLCSVAVTMLRRSAGGEMECLLIKRGKEPMHGYWALPGGGVEPGETIAQAAAREVSSTTHRSLRASAPLCFVCWALLPLLLLWRVLQVEEECCVSVSIAEPFYVTEVLPSASSARTAAAASAATTQYVLVHMLAAPLSASQLQQVRPASDATETRWLSITSVKTMEARTTNNKAETDSTVVVAHDNELIVPEISKVLDRAVLLYDRLFADDSGIDHRQLLSRV
jgi:hypothetical protein